MKKTVSRPRVNKIISFYQDGEYFSRLFQIAIPIALQNFIMSSLNMVGVMMIGQLGETSVAAVGLANQIFFLLNLLLFGITSGSAMFTAQLWGKRDIPNIRKVLGLSLFLGLAGALAFLAIAELIPGVALGIYTKDAAVVDLGSDYLRVFGWSFLFTAVTFSFSAVLRSIGIIKMPLVVSISAFSLNTVLSYGLIFGNLGLPKMGVHGAAVAILISRMLECGTLIWLTYHLRTPAAATLKEIVRIDLPFIGNVLKPVLPVAINELSWSLGITTYNVVYARIGTEAIAAMNIASTIDSLALVAFIGIGNACAIMVGNQIGANEELKAYRSAGRSIGLGIIGGSLVGGLILLVARYVLTLYKVSPTVIQDARNILTVIALFLWLRASNLILFVGVFRSGGDTRFALILDGAIIWIVGVPLAFIGAFVFHLPVYWVYVMVMTEEFTKWSLGIWRFFSKKWIHNLARTV